MATTDSPLPQTNIQFTVNKKMLIQFLIKKVFSKFGVNTGDQRFQVFFIF